MKVGEEIEQGLVEAGERSKRWTQQENGKEIGAVESERERESKKPEGFTWGLVGVS